MNTPLLIGLTGHKRAGKDTAAKILAELIGGDVAILHFADALKDEVAKAFGVARDHRLDNPDLKEVPSWHLSLDNLVYRDVAGAERFRFLAWLEERHGECDDLDGPRTPRQILQWWGEWRRSQDPHYWLWRIQDPHYWLWRITPLVNPAHASRRGYLIADVRYANEAQFALGHERVGITPGAESALGLAVLPNPGHLIRITNPQADADAKADTHESEQGLAFPFATHTINNSGDLAHLRAECERVLAEIRGQG